jgi:putative ABC transport system permease protein
MMIRLIVADALFNRRIWAGAFAVSVTATATGSVPAVLIRTAVETGGVRALGLAAVAGTVIAFTIVAVTIVVGDVMRATVALQSRSYALWRVVGVGQGMIRRVVAAQLAIVTAAGTAVGAVPACAAPAFVRAALQDASGLAAVQPTLAAGDVLVVAVIITALAIVAGSRAASTAAATPAVQAVRDGISPRHGRRLLRVLVTMALIALAVQMVSTLPASLPRGAPAAVLVGPVLVAACTVSAPLFAPSVVRVWTAAVPVQLAPSFVVARALVLNGRERSVTVVTALIVAIGLPSALDSGRGTVAAALDVAAPTGSGGIALVLAGPVMIAAVGAAAGAYMSARDRGREQALLRAAGATGGFVVWVAVWEAIVQLVSAALIVMAVVALAALSEALVLAPTAPTVVPVVRLPSVAAWTGVAAVPLFLATLLPAVAMARRDVPRLLAGEGA